MITRRKKITQNQQRTGLRLSVLVLFFVLSFLMPTHKAHACACAEHATTRALITAEHILTRQFIIDEFTYMQQWLLWDYYVDYIGKAWMKIAEQMTAVAMQQLFIIGTFLDAQQSHYNQSLWEELQAIAYNNYHPDRQICMIGTAARAMARNDQLGVYTANFLTKDSLDRQLGRQDSSGAGGPEQEKNGRVEQFKRVYCDIHDNSDSLQSMCTPAPANLRVNKDVDYTRVVDHAWTLDLDYSDATLTADEEDIIALRNNLFAHDVFSRVPNAALETVNNQEIYLDLRSVVAKRSVAENSFNAIIGMKSSGGNPLTATGATDAYRYMAAALMDITDNAITPTEISTLIGSASPGYYAQLEMLGRTIYENPQFFIDLYDKPTNAQRKEAAMQAVDLVIGRESYRSELRMEALWAVLLEAELIEHQKDTQNRVNAIKASVQK